VFSALPSAQQAWLMRSSAQLTEFLRSNQTDRNAEGKRRKKGKGNARDAPSVDGHEVGIPPERVADRSRSPVGEKKRKKKKRSRPGPSPLSAPAPPQSPFELFPLVGDQNVRE